MHIKRYYNKYIKWNKSKQRGIKMKERYENLIANLILSNITLVLILIWIIF